MEFSNTRKHMTCLGRLKCRRCGEMNYYDVMKLCVNERNMGLFRTTCKHCGASNVYHVASMEFEFRTTIDDFGEIEDI